ncbi:uncharacterized protein TNCV_1792931 [Trichonephila clavipes]|nr:uncharacterized protein TNCV_1792931 [Trichonephila clavipes]
MCCAMVRDVTERSVTAMRTICLPSREVVHLGGCYRPRRSIVPSCLQQSHIRITVVWFSPTRLPISLKDNPHFRTSAELPHKVQCLLEALMTHPNIYECNDPPGVGMLALPR